MNRCGFILREDFFDTDKIREVRAEEDGAEILCTFLELNTCCDSTGYISDDDIPEIAAALEYDEDDLRNKIQRVLEVELGEIGPRGFWVKIPVEID
ncbi:MAG: hypothetical protein J6Y26_06010 [Lachnospiraceae bacterium]|nr:hypothetical protein [Lachnospiraceae bacterium]